MIKSYLKKRINSVKCCAIITTICFVLSTIGANLYAIPISEQANKKYEDVFEQTKNIDNNYGKITSSKDAKSNITVVNIQDLHCHPQTQRNISKIISQIANNYNLKKIYVEGGYGNIDTNWLNSIKNENVKKQIIEKLLEDGILTGSEYYKLTHNSNIELKGIDEERIHKENIKRLAWLIQNQGKYQNIINKVNTEINILESMYVNNRNKNFNENIQKYILNKIDTKQFYKQLIKYVKDINKNPQNYNNITAIRLEDYPNINMFLSMVSDSNKVNLKEARIELQSLIILLKNKIPFDVYSRILKETNNFKDNQKSFELITLLCEKENINLNKKFKEVSKLLEININNKNFNPIRLVQEERQLIREIRKALSYNNDEYEITFLSDFNKYFKDYLEYKLTDADWKYFKKNYDTFRQIYSKYATIDRIKEIEYDFAEINKYYSINDKRNDIFVKNLLKDEKIYLMANDKIRNAEEILKDSKEVIVAVTGGFHSTELEEILSQKDVNTIIITPFIKDDTNKSNEKYAELIEEQSQINYQAIAYTIASCSGSKYQKQLLLKVIMEIFGKDSVSQIKEILGDVDLFEINDVEIQRTSKEDVDKLLSVINIAIDEVFVSIKSLKDIVSVDGEAIDNAMLKFVSALIERGFYFNKGAIFEIVNSKFDGKDLKGISPEIYSRMFSSLQNALLKTAIKEDKSADEINAPEFGLQDLYEDTGTTEYVNIYLEDINVSPEKFAEQIYSAMQNNQLIVLNVFRTPVEIDKLDKETQKRIYEEIRNMFFKIYTDKPLYSFISQPENKDFLNYDIHFFLLEILENSFMHGNKGIDKPIFLHMNLNDQKEVENLKIYNVNSSEDDNFQMRFIRMRLALLGGQHKSNVLMKQNPYRTFEIDPDFKGKFYKVSSDIKPFYDDIAAQNLRDNSSSINYFSIFAPLQDRNKIFKILSKIPHIWEEIVFRTIPISLSVLAMSVPAVSFVTVPLTLLFFFVCQNQFIKAHNISLWIKENNLSWSTGKILRATLFNIFPDKESKVSFNKFEQQNLIINETRQRYLPTMVLSIPYMFSLFFVPNIPVIILSTIVGVAIHKVFNSTFKLKMNIFDEYSESSISMSDDNYKYEKQEQIIDIEQPEYAEQEDESEILQNEDEGFGEVIDINADDFLTEEDNGYPKKKSVNKSKKNKSGKKTKTNKKKSKDKKSKTKKTTVSSSSVSSENDDDIRQPRGFTRQRIIQNFTKLAQSKDSFDSSLELNQQQIKDVLLRYGLSKHEVEKINFSDGLPDYIVSLLKSKNSQVVGTTIDINKSLIENLKEHPILFSLALETFTRVYKNEFDENATFGDLLSLISRRCAKRLYEATCTDLRGYFGEIYVVNTLIAGFIPDKRAGPIIIRPEMPEDNNIRGFDIYDIDRVKIQVKTGGSGIVHHHENRYSRVGSIMDIEREIEQGLIEIPVLTTKNVKNNSFSSDDRVQGMDVTTEAVTKFAHEFVSALYGIGFKKNISAVRNLKLKDLINSFKEIPTANPITKEELIDLLTNKNQLMDNKRIKDKKEEPQVVDINQQLINIDDLVNQNVVVRTKSRDVHVLYIDKNSIFLNDHSLEEQSRRVLESDDFSLYGISSVEYDDSGKIKNILFAEGTELSFLKQDGEPVGSKDKAENSSFSPEELNALYKDTNAKDYVDIYLDGDIDEICHLIKQAATKTKNKNKLIILHLFKDNFKTSELTPSQLFELYRKINVLFSRRFKLSDIFPNSNVYSQYTDYDIDFFFKQILKNALISGNSGNVELPIALNIKLDENENIQSFSVYNKSRSEDADIDEDKKVLATSAHLMLTGDSKSTEIMTHNSVREYSFNEKYEVGNTSFRKAEVSLRDSIDMRMYYLEQQYKQSEENVSISDIALQLGPTVRDLYIRGLEKYTKKYLKETGKTKEELTLEEILEIEEYAKHYNSTVSGIFYGVWLEKFSFFSKDFLSSHTNISFAGKVAYGVILSLSVAVGISCAVLSFSMLPIVMAIISTALLSPFLTVLSSMIMHSLWNLVNRNDMLQKDGNIRKDLVGVLKPVNLRKEIKDSEISSTFIEQAKFNGVEFISIYDLVKYLRKLKRKDFKNNEGIEIYRGPKPIESVRPVFLRRLDRKTPEKEFEDDCRIVENSFGFALGLSWISIFKGSKRKVNLVKAISKENNIVSWENGYKYFYGPKYPATPPEDYMDKIRDMCLKYDKKIFFFLPRNLMSHDLSFKTRREIEYIQQHPEMMKNVVFVFGTYDCFNIRNANIFGQYFNEDKIATTLRRLFSNPNAFISHKVSKISDRGLAKFFRNMSKLSVNGVFETIDVLKELEFSKKQDIEENEEAVLNLKTDIVENNRRQVCFICTANINRSAVSHLLFEDRLSKLGVDNISVVSAGLLPIAQTINEENLYLGQDYKKILEDFDVDPDLIDKFRSEEFAQKHIASDYFIVVSQKHKNLLIEKYNIAPDKIILYSDLDSDLIGDALPDPQKLKISKRDIVKLVNNIFDNSLFNFISNLKVEKILEILFKVKSAFIKYIAVNYNNIKSSEIEQILKMYEEENLVGEKDTADKEKFIDVYIVEDIGNLKGKYTLINTGIKADGKDIFKVQIDNLLIYGAKNVPRIKVVKALNETEQIKNEVKSILSIQGNIEIEGIVRRNGDGIGINDGLLEIGNMEFEKIQASQIKEFELSCLEIKHVLGIMCGEKTLIDLKSLSQEELLTAIESGRARKVITLEQYNQLMKLNLLNSDKISELLKNGIEIYVQSNDINISCAQNKIAGQIIEEGNKKYIYDYYTKDKIELKELTDEEDLLNLEKTIISSDGPVLVDIEILKKSFQGSNPIESITKLGTLAGKIKITMGLRNVNMKDIINIGYSVNFDKVPDLSLKDIQSLVETEDKETIINILGQTNVFSILFKSVENADTMMELKNIVIERTLTKQKLSEEGVLIPEKSLEIMLGKLLRRQVEKQYALDSESDENINKKVNEKIGSIKKGDVKDELIKNIEALKTLDDKKISEFDTIEQQVLVESIIQIILFDGEIIIQNQSQQIEEIDMSSLRAMLSAA